MACLFHCYPFLALCAPKDAIRFDVNLKNNILVDWYIYSKILQRFPLATSVDFFTDVISVCCII